MEELVSLVTQDPALDMEEEVHFKYPNTACELLPCDVPQINDRLGGDETLLNLLYDFLNQKKDKFLSLVLKHIGTSALMDLLLHLVSCVEPAGLRQEVLHWLNEEIIQRLEELIHASQDEDRQSNASQALCDIIRLGREQGSQLQEAPEPDPLLTVLESQDCMQQLLKNMSDGAQTELCLVSGTQVLLTLLEPRRAGMEGLLDSCSPGLDRLCAIGSSVLRGIEPWLKDFHQLLLSPPKKTAILTTIGVLEEPPGKARLHGARLVAALLHTDMPSINQELCRLNAMGLLLDLFEDRAVASGPEDGVEPPPSIGDPETPQPAASCPESTMVTHLFQKCCLVQRILEAWEASDHTQTAGGMRHGNMGHLTRIANTVVQNLEGGPMQTQVSEVIRGLPWDCRGRWESFVEETLTEANRRNAVDLVSTHHRHPSSEEEDVEGVFPSELSLQQAFSKYQIQQMTAAFVDPFGFSNEEFAEQDNSVNAPFDRIMEINFSVNSPGAALFEACCSDHIQPFDKDDDLWEDEEAHSVAHVTRARFGGPHASESCRKDGLERRGQGGEESSGADGDMARAGAPRAATQKEGPRVEGGSEAGAPWTVFDELESSMASGPAPALAMGVGSSVWAASSPSALAPAEEGWAEFADFQPFCCPESGPRCSSLVDRGHGDAQGGLNQGPERTLGPATPDAWNACVTRKAPLVASRSREDKQMVSVASEAVSVGPGREAILCRPCQSPDAVRTEGWAGSHRL
ncbi:Serine/threonine-protein phosphatase 6 regulatory subunit 2, partial [Eschrichtius robustus]|nr:Serine/threonine-protein phosphatase 6 regulatory subunit 2 [Eschrichtius robustus]